MEIESSLIEKLWNNKKVFNTLSDSKFDDLKTLLES